MKSSTARTGKGRPRISAAVQTRICSIRGSRPDNPPSLNMILEQLSHEGWHPLPGRGTVQRVVKEYEQMPVEVRVKDLPFELHLINRAGIPWEASDFVSQCSHFLGMMAIRHLSDPSIPEEDYRRYLDKGFPVFTNRWAAWCWRVHSIAPDFLVGRAMFLAWGYSREEMFHDLLPSHPPMNVRELNDILIYRPDKSKDFKGVYEKAMKFGVIPRPDFQHLQSVWLHDDVKFPQTRAFDVVVHQLFEDNIRNLLEPEQGEDDSTVDNQEESG